MADRNHVADKSTMHRYRVELPILIDDLDLSVYEFRLYVRFKRRAGDGGSCYEGTRALADACNMSMGQVSKAKKGLEEKGLIRIGTRQTRGGQTDEITIVDLWPRNFKAYAEEESVHQVNTLPESVHHTNTSTEVFTTRSLNRVSDHQVNTLTSKRSPGERKNHDQYHRESDPESPPPTMHDAQKNGAAAPGGGGEDLYRQLRRRKVGQAKAREIVALGTDPARILHLIDTRPQPDDPNSLGRVILDILDGVADAPLLPGAPPPPPAAPPLPSGMTPAERAAAGQRNDYRRGPS